MADIGSMVRSRGSVSVHEFKDFFCSGLITSLGEHSMLYLHKTQKFSHDISTSWIPENNINQQTCTLNWKLNSFWNYKQFRLPESWFLAEISFDGFLTRFVEESANLLQPPMGVKDELLEIHQHTTLNTNHATLSKQWTDRHVPCRQNIAAKNSKSNIFFQIIPWEPLLRYIRAGMLQHWCSFPGKIARVVGLRKMRISANHCRCV